MPLRAFAARRAFRDPLNQFNPGLRAFELDERLRDVRAGYLTSTIHCDKEGLPLRKEGLPLTHEHRGPVLKLEWVNAERAPAMMLRLTLCNHPELPDAVTNANRDAVKACYERKLGVAERDDSAGGFPIAVIEATTPLADFSYWLRSTWPEPVDSIAVTAGGNVIAALDAGAADDALVVGDTTAKAVVEQNGPVRLTATVEQAVGKDLAWLSKTAKMAVMAITINGVECRVICTNDVPASVSLWGAAGLVAVMLGVVGVRLV